MKKNHLVIVTGSSGYIGKNLVTFLNKKNLNLIVARRINNENYAYFDLNKKIVSKDIFKNKNIVLVHLATFFSKSPIDNNKISEANEIFGNKVFKDITEFNLTKIIYTNTMYSYYLDDNFRNLYYTVSKNKFSKFLKEETQKKSILLEEIFLDNTFGFKDTREKVIPAIMSAIVSDKQSPVQNKDAYINLIYLNDLLKRIYNSILDKNNRTTSFISKDMVNVNSIYDFLFYFYKNNEIDKNILKFKKNTYLINHPPIYLDNIKLSNIENKLINELKNYDS